MRSGWAELQSLMDATDAGERGAVGRVDSLHRRLVHAACRAQAIPEHGVAVFSSPEVAAPAPLAAARAAGVERVICGFLPDELPGQGFPRDETASWFLDHAWFVPFVLPALVARDSRDRHVWLVLEGDDAAQLPSSLGALAEAVAGAWSEPLRTVYLDRPDGLDQLGSVGRGDLIVNGASSWLGVFAVDELAARAGCRVFRHASHEYSPLRYGLLALDPPAASELDASHLRPKLEERHRDNGSDSEWVALDPAWFAGLPAAALWRELFQERAFRDFWDGGKRSESGHGAGPPGSWVSRAVGWSALAAAHRSSWYPRPAADKAIRTAATWLVQAQQKQITDPVMNEAAVRWMCRWPEWLGVYRDVNRQTREARQAVERWILYALCLPGVDLPVREMLTAAEWAAKPSGEKAGDLGLLLAWATHPSRVSEMLATRGRPDAVCRAACVEAALSGWWAQPAEAPGDGAPSPGLARLVVDPEPWTACFGDAGPVFRGLFAIRAGSLHGCRSAWREFEKHLGAVPMGAITALFRAAFPDRSSFRRWLGRLAYGEEGARWKGMAELVEAWRARYRWELRRATVSPRLRRGRAVAVRLMVSVTRQLPDWIHGWRAAAVMHALEGQVQETVRALDAFAACGGRDRAFAMGCAADLSLQGDLDGARELLRRWPGAPDDAVLALFLEAVTLALCGEGEASESRLAAALQRDPAFFGPGRAADGRWEFAALVLRRSAQDEGARWMHAQAMAMKQGSDGLFEETPCAGLGLPAAWHHIMPTGGAP